eukprot:TRINITY_DN65490_c0_g1_i1.p1 TRINITY_DN65490_c0_g1~~TRINITY_DN65490_c0_g1_i1.p1  ORF type:complete len:357 (+),score=110.55 TRINITY_DN65490_c0_g1_i1:85-1071(+)
MPPLPQQALDEAAAAFKRDGIAVIRGFAPPAECAVMKARMAELLQQWDPRESEGSVFHTSQDKHVANEYFLGSSETVRFFLEPNAVDAETGALSPGLAKELAVNKCGHALHWQDAVFRDYATSDKVSAVAQSLGWKDPVLPQSMYIFKQPRVGGEVTSHQDSTFLFTTPRQTCLGLWLALDPASEENGCLWARLGSHTEGVRRHFHRNPDYFARPRRSEQAVVFSENRAVPRVPWEGTVPDDLKGGKWTPLPVAAGDLVLIHGAVDHCSLPNTSDKQRHSFQLHLVEGPSQGVAWHPANWLQYTGGRPFPPLRPPKGGAARAPPRPRM